MRTEDEEFAYSCSQSTTREQKEKTSKPGKKARDARRMERFPCAGWLFISEQEDSDNVTVRIKHDCHHPAYIKIDLPDKWKEYIDEHARTQTPGQVWHSSYFLSLTLMNKYGKIWAHIVREETHGHDVKEAGLPFESKAVYYYWQVVSRQSWKLAPDPVESAREFIRRNEHEHNVALLDVIAQPGTQVLAFEVKDFMREWARNTQELAIDSTCEQSFALFGHRNYSSTYREHKQRKLRALCCCS